MWGWGSQGFTLLLCKAVLRYSGPSRGFLQFLHTRACTHTHTKRKEKKSTAEIPWLPSMLALLSWSIREGKNAEKPKQRLSQFPGEGLAGGNRNVPVVGGKLVLGLTDIYTLQRAGIREFRARKKAS